MATNNNGEVSGWVGWVYFASFMIILSGIFQLIVGFTALLNDTFLVAGEGSLVVFDITTWGWIHFLIGMGLLGTGIALANGSTWARVLAVVLVLLNFVAQFAFINAYPLWTLVIMVIDLLVLYALTVHGDETKTLAS